MLKWIFFPLMASGLIYWNLTAESTIGRLLSVYFVAVLASLEASLRERKKMERLTKSSAVYLSQSQLVLDVAKRVLSDLKEENK